MGQGLLKGSCLERLPDSTELHCQRPLKAVTCVDKYSQLDCDTIQKKTLLFSHSLPKGVIG